MVVNETGSAQRLQYNLMSSQTIRMPTLAASFVSGTLKRRQALLEGAIPTSFRPPPRISMVDQRRENWFQALANPNVPLEKLSSSVPVGLRGRPLLDHCAQRKVDPLRATWLIRCIGSNDLRSLRRKGTMAAGAVGAERKWMTEWTLQVTAFMDATVRECAAAAGEENVGTPEKLRYMIDLVDNLYHEKLVNRQQYLDLIVDLISKSTIDRLPLLNVIAAHYVRDICAYNCLLVKFARALLRKAAEAETVHPRSIHTTVLSMLRAVNHKHRGSLSYAGLSEDITNLLDKFSHSATDSLPIGSPPSASSTPQSHIPHPPPFLSPTQLHLSHRVDLLDSILPSIDLATYAQSYFALSGSISEQVSTICRWAISKYRFGAHRIYLASGLLSMGASFFGVGVRGGVEAFLEKLRSESELEYELVPFLLGELERVGVYSYSHYLRRMLSLGLLRRQDSGDSGWRPSMVLQAPIPVNAPGLRRQRNASLLTAGISVDVEEQQLRSVIAELTSLFSTQGEEGFISDLPAELKEKLCGLWRDSQMQVAQTVTAMAYEAFENQTDSVNTPTAIRTLTLAIRVLELMDEYHGLFTVLTSAYDVYKGPDFVGMATLTFRRHLAIWSAMGKLGDVHRSILKAVEQWPQSARILRELRDFAVDAWAPKDVLDRISGTTLVNAQNEVLHHDIEDILSQVRRVSDLSAAEALAGDMKGDLDTDTTMFPRLCSAIFDGLTDVTASEDSNHEMRVRSQAHILVCCLRETDWPRLHQYICDWASGMLTFDELVATSMQRFMVCLISHGCLPLPTAAAALSNYMLRNTSMTDDQIVIASIEKLIFILKALFSDTPQDLSLSLEEYVFLQHQRRTLRPDLADHVLRLLRCLMILSQKLRDPEGQQNVRNTMALPKMHSFIREVCIRNPLIWQREFLKPLMSSAEAATVAQIMDFEQLVFETPGSYLQPQPKLKQIIDSADFISLPFCQAQLQSCFEYGSKVEDMVAVLKWMVHYVLDEASNTDFCGELLRYLDSVSKRKICEFIEEDFLNNVCATLQSSTQHTEVTLRRLKVMTTLYTSVVESAPALDSIRTPLLKTAEDLCVQVSPQAWGKGQGPERVFKLRYFVWLQSFLFTESNRFPRSLELCLRMIKSGTGFSPDSVLSASKAAFRNFCLQRDRVLLEAIEAIIRMCCTEQKKSCSALLKEMHRGGMAQMVSRGREVKGTDPWDAVEDGNACFLKL
ncbi:RNA polymerase II mediator complex subunit [Saitoella coloradoensis]